MMPMPVRISQATNDLLHKVIVVVDDDEDTGVLISELINTELTIEYATPHVRYHVTGKQTLQAISTSQPHLFILDYNLPDMNGLELHDRLHMFEHLRNVPTLLISSVKPPMRELQKRAITFLAKPFDLLELLNTITKLLA